MKDLRTGHESTRPEAVFDGDLDGFIAAGIALLAAGAGSVFFARRRKA